MQTKRDPDEADLERMRRFIVDSADPVETFRRIFLTDPELERLTRQAWAENLAAEKDQEARADQDRDDMLDREHDARVLAEEERRTVQHAERFERQP